MLLKKVWNKEVKAMREWFRASKSNKKNKYAKSVPNISEEVRDAILFSFFKKQML